MSPADRIERVRAVQEFLKTNPTASIRGVAKELGLTFRMAKSLMVGQHPPAAETFPPEEAPTTRQGYVTQDKSYTPEVVRRPEAQADRTYVAKPAKSTAYEPLGLSLERILLVPDTHAPFHDRAAWAAMLNFAQMKGIHTIVHLGDLADFYSVSDHDKDSRRAHNLVDESEATNVCLDELDALPKVRRKIFCQGNHEYRLNRHIMRAGGALLDAVSVDTLLSLTARGWDVFDYGQHVRIGDLYVTHDVGRSGQNAVFQAAQVMGHNVCTGHTHRLTQAYFGTACDDRYVSATLGWLGDVGEANYVCAAVRASWQHGFGLVEMEPSGNFRLHLIPIVKGRVVAP